MLLNTNYQPVIYPKIVMGVIAQCWRPGGSCLLKVTLWLSLSYPNLQDSMLLLIARECHWLRFTNALAESTGPQCSWGLPHIHLSFQLSSAFPNPAEGRAVMNDIYIDCMGM